MAGGEEECPLPKLMKTARKQEEKKAWMEKAWFMQEVERTQQNFSTDNSREGEMVPAEAAQVRKSVVGPSRTSHQAKHNLRIQLTGFRNTNHCASGFL